MTTYICKCGRQVKKATNADNTGNRDTKGCNGCPYLLPWGPDKYIEGQGFTKDVQGYECRMSPTISYTTTYRGQAFDKCTLHILSLDLDFLDEVQAWIYDNAADTLSAGFSRGSMRGIDFSDKGRYSLSISCTQNKKGMAAKAALIEHFFTGGRVRKDMTLVQEKAHILAAIKEGKENASKMNYIISEHSNGLLYAYYKGLFWFWHKDQNIWVPSDFARLKYEQAKAKDGKITPEDILDNGEFFALEEYQVPLKLRTALEALTPADSKIPAPDAEGAGAKENTNEETADCLCSTCTCTGCHENCFHNCTACGNPVTECNSYQTEGEKRLPASAEPPEIVDECSEPDEGCPYLQPLENSKKYSCQCAICGDKFVNREICNKSFRSCGWYLDRQDKEAQTEDDEEEASTADVCQCRTCGRESCFAHGCAKECPANAEESCLTVNCPEYIERTETTCNCQATAAPTGDAAATTDASAAPEPPQAAETTTTSESGEGADTSMSLESGTSAPSTSQAPGCPAADGDAESEAIPAAAPATSPASLPAFDYTGLDAQTVQDLHLAEREFAGGKRMAEIGLRRMADGVAIAHAALCGCDNLSQAHNNQHSEKTFGRWCDSVGLNRKAAERLLQVARLFDGSTPREEKVLEELGPSLLYAAAKPSAPAELVQAVKDGDITTHKQYQEALAEIRARDAKINDLLEMSEAADRRAEEEQRKRKEADEARIAAENKVQQYREIKDAALETAKQQREKAASADARARAAENRADGAEKLAELRGTENTELKAKIQEMENQPRDVAVIQPSEDQIEAWRREGAERLTDTVKDQVSRANKEKLDAQRQVVDLQKQLEESRPDADACQRTVDILYETTENLRLLLRSQLKQARLSPNAYGKVVAHVLQAARNLMDTVRVCSPDGYDMDSEEDDDFE